MDMEAGVGVREIRPWMIAGVGVGARVVGRVLEALVEEAIYRAASGHLVPKFRAWKHFRVREVEVQVVHGRTGQQSSYSKRELEAIKFEKRLKAERTY